MEGFQGYTTLVADSAMTSWTEAGSGCQGYYVVSRNMLSESTTEAKRWSESEESLHQSWSGSTVLESTSSPGIQKVSESRREQAGSSRVRPGSEQTKTSKRKRRRVISTEQRRAANIRERKRMFQLNEAFAILRKRVPTFAYEKKLSRIETLRLAVNYITFMSELVNGDRAASDSEENETKTAKVVKEFILKDLSEDENENITNSN